MTSEQSNTYDGVGRAGLAASILLLVPILYILSIGPAQWLCQHGLISNSFMQTVYHPSDTFGGTGKDSTLSWYLSLWE